MQELNLSPVITTKRRHSAAFKRKILELVEQPGASVAAVALEHGVNANLVFKWRKAKLDRRRPPRAMHLPVLLPVSVDPQESPLTVPTPEPERSARKEGVIEVEIGGARVLLRGCVDPVNVRSVLLALRDCA
ncbi:transposase [Rhodoferax sp. TBRC 17198]|jgi:transposase|uniref:Transposase n=1 Tax=Rhodoferax potami TaxID=3068338 RepID=A0ABU3KSP0_9BURK|nr:MULTISPECIES: transposase [unclassified Rhodoferax]MDT7520670.1 transposase [Rhodoferax sp. TBRC 17660]MDT7524428.1 transposase [Rhodoferax sp. TBRC 17198]